MRERGDPVVHVRLSYGPGQGKELLPSHKDQNVSAPDRRTGAGEEDPPSSVLVREKTGTGGNRTFPLLRQRERPAAIEQQDPQERLNLVLAELANLVGLDEVKRIVRELCAFAEVQKMRACEGLVTEPVVMHMIFKGNPGTGKTTVARILGRLFKELGVLPKGHLVEAERADLVGEYIGHTAQKAREHLKKALGGVLFLDEAYSLARGGEKDFGKEAIDTLVKGMEDHRQEMVLILAGYKDEMNWFLQTNPGLRSRFPLHLEFPDFTAPQLMAIARSLVQERQYILLPEAEAELERILRRQTLFGHRHSGNARLVRNLVEAALRRQAVRLHGKGELSREDLMALTRTDLREAACNFWAGPGPGLATGVGVLTRLAEEKPFVEA